MKYKQIIASAAIGIFLSSCGSIEKKDAKALMNLGDKQAKAHTQVHKPSRFLNSTSDTHYGIYITERFRH